MQTITTKYLGATNTLGARIKATTSSGISKTISYPYELSGSECHIKALRELNKQLDWSGDMTYSSTDTGYIFAFVDESSMITL
jgi:hypothetical protein